MNTSILQRLPDDIAVEITRKDIRTLRLSVHAPDGRVKVSAPVAMPEAFISAFVLDRLGWIRKHQLRLAARHEQPACRYADGEHHWFSGRRYVLKVIERQAPARVALGDDSLVLQVRPGASAEQRRALLDAWYRRYLKAALPSLIAGHQPRMGVQVQAFGVKRMKTRWGSCNPRARRIWLNLELARAPSECLEYVVVHEMVHLLERRHNTRFHALMDRFLPGWREHKDRLNSLPLRF
ncbi:MAG: SprT family zinc-dependent metalloprotease [Gammaproteobacteria bacterium]